MCLGVVLRGVILSYVEAKKGVMDAFICFLWGPWVKFRSEKRRQARWIEPAALLGYQFPADSVAGGRCRWPLGTVAAIRGHRLGDRVQGSELEPARRWGVAESGDLGGVEALGEGGSSEGVAVGCGGLGA